MEILLECGEERVIQFIQSSDPDFLCLVFIKFLHVTKLEGEPTEVLDRNLPFTLDREYFITFKKPETRAVFQPFLEILYHFDSNQYRLLMESLLRELESNLEETGYRFRNARLADYGFPDFEQALEIYRFVNPNALRVEKEIPRVAPRDASDKTRPTFYLTSPRGRSIFLLRPLQGDRSFGAESTQGGTGGPLQQSHGCRADRPLSTSGKWKGWSRRFFTISTLASNT